MSEYLSQTDLLKRPYWNTRLVKKLLGEPDNTLEDKKTGRVMRKKYRLERIEEAETTGFFCERIADVDRWKAHEEQRKEDFRASLAMATQMDLEKLQIPKNLTGFRDVFEACKQQMHMRNAIFKAAWDGHADYIIFHASPEPEICKRIAEERPELAFQDWSPVCDLPYGYEGFLRF